MRTVPRPLHATAQALVVIAGLLLIGIMFLTVADVIGRASADTSILGTVEISQLALVGIAYLGLAAAELDDRHVSVDLVEKNVSRSVRRVFAWIRTALFVVVGVILTWGLWISLTSAMERGEVTNGILRLSTWPIKVTLLVSFVLFLVVAIWRSVNELLDFRDGVISEHDQAREAGQAGGVTSYATSANAGKEDL